MNFFKTSSSNPKSDALKVHNSNSENNSYLESGTTIKGEVSSSGNLYFNSKLNGRLSNTGKLSIGAKAVIEGEVEGKVVHVEGEVKGMITVSDVLVLKSTAKIEGDIVTDKLIVEDGARMNGNCSMNHQSNVKSLLVEQSA